MEIVKVVMDVIFYSVTVVGSVFWTSLFYRAFISKTIKRVPKK